MFKLQDVKEEEKYNPAITQCTSIIKVQKSDNSTMLQQYSKTIEKFQFALIRLQEAQYQDQNQVIPKYPFVFQYAFNEIMVHLGGHQIQLKQIEDLKKYEYQQQYYQTTKPIPQLKLSVQKRKGFSTLEQKDSKNIPKNYCKAIITYAQKNQPLCREILKEELKVAQFIEYLTTQKKKLLNIRVFKALLQQCDDPLQNEFNRTFRIISQIFIKKYAINYIFNSKIVQHNWHIRYRQQIYKGIRNPKSFSHIKKL
ncbi:unnamed protein product [Paramecium pentaurelia]|uniref:Uncharacterized protein n=1 Tax=Paramecium pentaurelia TaxID=43138 RepID=A0A8S1UYP1_9CILI|nr:unnamed protein product [Paramecium pentaurelia]